MKFCFPDLSNVFTLLWTDFDESLVENCKAYCGLPEGAKVLPLVVAGSLWAAASLPSSRLLCFDCSGCNLIHLQCLGVQTLSKGSVQNGYLKHFRDLGKLSFLVPTSGLCTGVNNTTMLAFQNPPWAGNHCFCARKSLCASTCTEGREWLIWDGDITENNSGRNSIFWWR